MEIKSLAVCLAVCAAVLTVCHGCSTGKEFITTFLPNYQRNARKDHRLHVVLTAQDSEANVHIQVASVGFSRRLTLSAGETRWVSLPCGSELQQQFVTENSAIRITSSAIISVVSFNRRYRTGDGAVVSPTNELGTDYFVYTPSGGMTCMDRLLAIVNGNSQNKITISPGAPSPTLPPDPCEDLKCRVKERCENGKCVHVSTATCRAMGDPHYQTFDGRRYDFQVKL
ncbi:uncharacterized protein LOC125892574 [Epinephelus fuscoguttatus]|uniref:uncharacterized protein LOC125892574 n=1 Tax=Epinephelus fuscoguttatus TaxID=293821 RepID=UPI0020D1A280|nr:uncharacterized protein LOC125892574 [Epinephelus fuscoguttatus]